ncbi:MAG: hypothetical protein K1X67_16570 [Fimbriimonadaceae bacterium]|nr:hypothetical protein [Fimbriimonadaceae bacterium]
MKTRILITVLALAAAWPGVAQDLDKKVSLTLPATDIKEALRLLSAQSGVELEASGRVAGEPLLLSVRDVTVQDLMPRIANALRAEWEKTAKGFRLTRSPALDRQQENAELAARTVAIKRSLARYLDQHQQMGAWDQETLAKLIDAEKKQRERTMKDIERNLSGDNAMMISMASNGSQTPAGTALYEILSTLSARDLATIQPGSRVVYASSPTQMQRSAPFDYRKAIDRFVASHNMLANAVANEPALPAKVTFQGGLDLQAKPIGAISKLLLIVNRQAADSPLTLHLKLADPSGKIVGTAQAFVDIEPVVSETQIKAPEKTITLSESSDELIKLLREDGESSRSSVNVMEINGDRVVMSSGEPESGKPITPGLLTKLSKPEQFDPLSLFVSESLIQAAEAKGAQLVASPPDAAFGAFARALSKESSASTVFSTIGQAGMIAEEKDGWLVLSPTQPFTARRGRIDRRALGSLLRSIVGSGYARLNEMGAYAASLPTYREEKGPDDHYLEAISPAAYRDYRDMLAMSEGMLTLYGLLSSEQRRVLESGQNLLARNLGPAQSAQVANIIYNRPSGLPMIRGEGMAMMMTVSAGTDDQGGPPDFGSDSLAKEPTEMYPTGIPAFASLSLRLTPEEAVYSRLPGSRDGRFFTAGELGMMQGMAEREASAGSGIRPPNFTKFRAANLARLEIKLSMNDKQAQTSRLRDAWVLSNSLDVALDALPAAFLKKMRDAQERMRNIRVGEGSPPPVP